MEYEASEHSGVLIFKISGFLRGYPSGYEFLELFRQKMVAGTKKVILDLGGVEKISSAGVGILASIFTSADNAEGTLLFVNIPPRVEKLIEVVGLLRVLKVYPTLQDALKSLSGSS